jgi:hypothetical protein
MATKPNVPKPIPMTDREKLLMAYLDAKSVLDDAESKCKVAQEALKKDLGETTETMCGPFKVLYRPDKEIDTEKLKAENPAAHKKCVTKFDVTLFRVLFPELVTLYERDSKKRPLKIVAV